MAGYKCPFCNEIMSINNSTMQKHSLFFSGSQQGHDNFTIPHVKVTNYRCPNEECARMSIHVSGTHDLEGLDRMLWPPFTCIYYPEYVPQFIQQDYQEACAIKDISPKASATLSRRCLQGMIRDYWGIVKQNLHQEIVALDGKIDDEVMFALLALKSIGNIGAHPETDVNLMVDVEPDEAAELIAFIEFLIDDWYVTRENRKGLFGRLRDINTKKSDLKPVHSSDTASN